MPEEIIITTDVLKGLPNVKELDLELLLDESSQILQSEKGNKVTVPQLLEGIEILVEEFYSVANTTEERKTVRKILMKTRENALKKHPDPASAKEEYLMDILKGLVEVLLIKTKG